ncbi:hypothetical protein PRZ48_006388 [Zasmidium cellare]|uniref:Rhodopsin domain-containing protein n=1 Tax=Zasmidium cellare TaxID=395010 RepID=A0ABR0ENX1_ZASCE|nr:hypothetical protein PRZ48_006388 [Zasmidium cellare]
MACWIVIGLLAALFVSFEFATIFQCIPVSYNWTSVVDRTATGSCTDRLAQVYTAAAFNIFFDVLVLLLPVPSLLKLNISWMKKLGVGIVFMVGILVTICSIVRLSYLSKYGDSTNITWNYAYIGIWSLLEVHLSIVCVCVPAAAGLFYRTWRHVKHGSPAESMDLDDRSNRGEKQMLGGNSDTMPPRTLQTTAQVSGLGLSNLDLESGTSAKSDDGSSSPPDFDEVRKNLGDKDKERPPYELHGNSENSHEASTSRPALHEKKKSSESRGSGSNTRPALPSQSQSNESHVLGNDRPILLSPTESKERQEKYRAFQTQPDMRESQFRPAMQSPGSSEESIDRSAPLSPASPQADEARPGPQSNEASKDSEQRPALKSTGASKDSQQRPSLHSRVQSRDSQGRPSPLSPGQLDETMVAGTARPSFYEYRPSGEFEQPTDQHPAFRSDEQSQYGQSVDGDRPSLYNFGQSKDGQSMYSGRPALFSPPSKDNQSYYSDRPVLHSSQSNDGSMAYRPSFDSQGYSRDQVFQARPAFFAQGPSSSQQWQSNMSSRGHSRDGSTARPALFSQFQSKDSLARPPFRSPGHSKDTGISNMTRPALNSSGTSRQGYNDEDIQDNIAAASAMVGVGALEQQDQQHTLPPAKSPARSSYTKSPQAQSPGVNEHDQNADLAATIADALVGVRQMQQQLAMKNEDAEPEPKSPSKSSQDTRNDSATETSEKPLSSPWSFNGRSKSYRDQADTASPVGSPLASPFSSLGSPNTMAGRDHPLRSQGRQTSFEGEKLRQRAATIESEARERALEETQSPKTPKTPKSARFETRAAEEEQRRLDATEVAAPEAVGVAATVAATATVPAAAAAALGEKRELTRRSRSESELKEDIEERKRAEAWRPITPSISRSASHEDHPLNSAPRHNPYEDEQMRKGAGTQTDFPYESEENLSSPQPERMSPELQHYKRQRAAESEAALADAYYEHMERKYSQPEPPGPYEEEHKATRRAERAARRAASAASDVGQATPHNSQDIGEMLSAMASAVGEVGDQPAEEDRNRAGMDEVAQPEAAMDDNPLRGLRTSDPIETELEAEQATELAIADAAPPPTIHRSRSNSRSSRPDPSPIQRRHRPSNEQHDVYELEGGSAPPPTIHRSRSNSNSNTNYKYTSRRHAGEDSGAESATENDHPLRSQGKSGLYSHPNSRPTSFTFRRRTTQSDSAAESANEDDHPLRSQGRSGLYPNNSTESLDAAQTRNASVVAIKAAAEQRRARQKRRQSGNSVQSAKSDSSTEILYEGRANAKKEKTYKSFVTEPARPLGRGASPRGFGRGGEGYGNGYGYGGGRGYYREPSPMSSNSEEYRVRVTERPGSGGSRELRMPFREWEGDEEGW